jgi:hypothetical protein
MRGSLLHRRIGGICVVTSPIPRDVSRLPSGAATGGFPDATPGGRCDGADMTTQATDTQRREPAHRTADGMDIRLLWDTADDTGAVAA